MHGTWDVLKVVKTRSFQAAIETEGKPRYSYALFHGKSLSEQGKIAKLEGKVEINYET